MLPIKARRIRSTAMPRRAVLLIGCLIAPLAVAQAQQFVAGTEDVPLMPGLAAVAGTSFAFDKPEGRIVGAEAHGKLSRAAVRGFYAATLPQLGWVAAPPDRWQRESEALRIEFKGRDGDLTVGFTLSPRGGGSP